MTEMSRPELVQLLNTAGVQVTAEGPGPHVNVETLDGIYDPMAIEKLGIVLAERLRGSEPTRVLIWEEPENLIPAHIVARELGVTVTRAVDAQGLLAYDGFFKGGDRVVILAVAHRSEAALTAMKALVRQHAATVVTVAALIDTPILQAHRDDGIATAFVDTGTPPPSIGSEV